jgi:ATP-binding cassette subfamily C protein LapB
VLALPTERGPDRTLLVPDGRPREVRLEQVRFGYQGSPVRRLDIPALALRAGDRALVLGPVGCGKSTLLKVLAGLYRPAEGRVRLGEADLWETDPQVVAAQVGYLPQSTHLFKGSLRSNLSLSGTASDSGMLGIARALGIDAIAASSPQGMDLEISEGGDGLSGGQRQLVALARVAIGEPTVWLLDEPTASLDADSELRVWQLLNERVGPEDILVVATHRPLQAMRLANRVIVMQDGQIVRDGPPARVVPQLARAAGLELPADAPVTTSGRVSGESRHVG